ILKCTGRKSLSGKSKGGIKAHSVLNADEKVPEMVWFSSGATNDQQFLKKLKLDSNTIYVFDKGYNDYKAFKLFTDNETGFVTRLKDNAKFEINEENSISDTIHSGVLLDTIIEVEVKENNLVSKLKLRKIRFYDRENKRVFEFITNLFDFRADTVAALYKIRWQIELVFKQLKQNFPLKYFLGDNENAIKIQIYCALIANLLIEVIRKTLKKKWSFSNLVSFCRIHLFNYIHIVKFLESSEKQWEIDKNYYVQFGLFDKNSADEILSSA
ncbi:IS4 family transposase, partial [Flavobacterium sp.]|uniref:IS4 family transposase n=1 Tax=Flavobacterium sp. TaxID=239 RepID=UPI00286E7660